VDLATGAVTDVEVRLRWRDRDLTDVEQQITEAGLRPSIERALLTRALGQHRSGMVSVALSAAYLASASAVDDIRDALTGNDISAEALTIRITDVGDAAPALRSLRDLGVRICLDRFGTRPLPLADLRELPLDTVRLDPRLLTDPPLLAAVLSLARGLELTATADGVTTGAQAAELRALGCARAAGPLFRAVPLVTAGG
jgi:EAL domain-containing protein (putative c-di-GMP-specific phosphodiesterase class I)